MNQLTAKQFTATDMVFQIDPRSPRPLKLKELRQLTDAELIIRAKYLRFGDPPLFRPILKNQAALVVRVQRERIADKENFLTSRGWNKREYPFSNGLSAWRHPSHYGSDDWQITDDAINFQLWLDAQKINFMESQ